MAELDAMQRVAVAYVLLGRASLKRQCVLAARVRNQS
jgi:hypothetical protein